MKLLRRSAYMFCVIAIIVWINKFVQGSALFYDRENVSPWYSIVGDLSLAIAFILAIIYGFKSKEHQGRMNTIMMWLYCILPILFIISALRTIIYDF
ncbi:F0F1-type ATP synthase membrane subunit a [Alkalicoccobacillus murimartini]|uniref:F0F1-type ATP synthase membrane subunit a n=1 Tax=Alkalicoccobacillus murimartini TaxID=171685 RepID=A0ABT9YD88_9BACI|nr:F0F1-type ATP synthase membrane subunit a [Alkalicoccobacillus murimartini]